MCGCCRASASFSHSVGFGLVGDTLESLLASRIQLPMPAEGGRRGGGGGGGEENNCKVWPFLFMLCFETILIELRPNCSKCRAERINAGPNERVVVQRNKKMRECARINCKEHRTVADAEPNKTIYTSNTRSMRQKRRRTAKSDNNSADTSQRRNEKLHNSRFDAVEIFHCLNDVHMTLDGYVLMPFLFSRFYGIQ